MVSCARQEAFGLSLVEAMLLERAVVYAGAGGPLEYMADGKTGLSYPPGDAARLAAQLDRLIARPTQRKKLGRQARAQAKKLFSRAGYGDKAFNRALELRGQPPRVLSALGDAALPIFETAESLASLVGAGSDEFNLLLQSVRGELAAAQSRAMELENTVEAWSNEAKSLQHGVEVWSKQAHDLETDRATIRAQLAELQESLTKKSEEFDRELGERNIKIETITKQIKELDRSIEVWSKQVRDLEAAREELVHEIAARETQLAELRELRTKKSEEFDRELGERDVKIETSHKANKRTRPQYRSLVEAGEGSRSRSRAAHS